MIAPLRLGKSGKLYSKVPSVLMVCLIARFLKFLLVKARLPEKPNRFCRLIVLIAE